MILSTIRFTAVNANPPLCSSCGGKCCQQMPGSLLPTDLSPTLDPQQLDQEARRLLKTGRYAIDWWEGSPMEAIYSLGAENGYYLRPAIKGSEGPLRDGTWGGPCTFHSETGCELSATQRPGECKALVPGKTPEDCAMPEGWEGKRTVAQAWWPFRHLLSKIIHDAWNDKF